MSISSSNESLFRLTSLLVSHDVSLNHNPGALRATNNKGLQPAMEFIIEHDNEPIFYGEKSGFDQLEESIMEVHFLTLVDE